MTTGQSRFRDICDGRGLVFIKDAAQAHGATCRGKKTGALGDLACFSFDATKDMATGEGGGCTGVPWVP